MRGRDRTFGPSRLTPGRSRGRAVARSGPWPQANASPYYTRKAAWRRRRRILLGGGIAAIVIAVIAFAIWGYQRAQDTDRAAPHVPVALLPVPGWEPLAALDALAVIDDDVSLAETSYDRDHFGQRWADVDRNGCDTRNDTLRRDLDELVVREGTQGCVAQSGTLLDPYTGQEFSFERGTAHAGELHIDHIVALADAWHKGAEAWAEERRTEFANDPMNLVATLGYVNQSKGASDASSWVPPEENARCGFAVHVVWVKEQYELAVATGEAATLEQLLSTCRSSSPPLVGAE